MPQHYQFNIRKLAFLPLLRALLIIFIFLVIAFQVAWFASLPPFNLSGLASVDFIDLSNYGQFAISFLCTAIAFYLYATASRRSLFLLTGFSSGLWFLSNAFWFMYVKIIGRNLLYPGIADVGFLGAFLLLATAIWLTFGEKKLPKLLVIAIYVVPLATALILAMVNTTGQTMMNVGYCLLLSLLLLAVIQYYDKKYRLFFVGVTCYSATMFAYVMRETYFPAEPVFTIVGQLAMISFCLIPLGLIKPLSEDRT